MAAPWSSFQESSRSHSYSPTRKQLSTTLHSSQSLTGRPSIMTYRNTQYPSASAALDAYIANFENQNPSVSYHRTVEDLLSPRSLLQLTVQRSLETGTRDTKDEERRYNMKKMLDESYHQIMRADIEMQKARELVKSSKLLSQSPSDPYMSPLPGSSNITDQLTDISMSTDAMIQAPAFLERHRKPASGNRSSHHDRYGIQRKHIERPNSVGNVSARKNGVHRTHPLNLSDITNKHMYDSNEATINGDSLKNAFENHETTYHNTSRVSFQKPISSINHHHLSKSNSVLIPQTVNTDSQSGMTSDTTETLDTVSSIVRPAPSWIDDLEAPGRPPPSWIEDLNTSGRPPPSWIHDLDESGITLRTLRSHPHEMSRIKDMEHTLEMNRPGNLRNLSFASELLISRGQTGDRSHDLRITDLENGSTSSLDDRYTAATKLRENMYREHDQRMLANKDVHYRSKENEAIPVKHSSRGLEIKHRRKSQKNTYHDNSRNFNKSNGSIMNESFTTDDLLNVSPTGRDFTASKSSKISPNSDKKSHRYSKNRSPKISRRNDSYTSDTVRQSGNTKHRTHRVAAGKYAKDSSPSTNTESLVYTPPRGVGSKRLHDSRHSTGTLRMTRTGSEQYVGLARQVDEEIGSASKETRAKERVQRLLNITETQAPRPRLQSSPSGQSTNIIPSLHTSPIAVGVDHARSFLTEEVLEGDRSWERNLPSIKAPQPVDEMPSSLQQQQAGNTARREVMEQFLDDCLVSSNQDSPRLTNGRQPGPVEALKNMLFTLQQITPEQQAEQGKQSKQVKLSETDLTQKVPASWSSSPKDVKSSLETASSTTVTTTDFDEAPGGKSLQRAMHHLSKLKSLVYDSPHDIDDDHSSKLSSNQAVAHKQPAR